jgi:putative transposase
VTEPDETLARLGHGQCRSQGYRRWAEHEISNLLDHLSADSRLDPERPAPAQSALHSIGVTRIVFAISAGRNLSEFRLQHRPNQVMTSSTVTASVSFSCHSAPMPCDPRQLQIDLRPVSRWGGPRPGAGRKPGPNPGIRHRSRGTITERHPCHVTIRVRRGVPSLRSARLVAEFSQSLRESCERGRFRVVHWVLMRDHVHAIVEAASARDLASGMKAMCARLARAVNRVFRRCGRVIADRFHLHVLRTPREVRAAIAYVLLNARRHAAKAGRRNDPIGRIDPASSGSWFDGWSARVGSSNGRSAVPETGLRPVARARSWLLSVGWRRVGLIDPAEIPGPCAQRSGRRGC